MTSGKRTIHESEIFLPDVADAGAPDVGARALAPSRAPMAKPSRAAWSTKRASMRFRRRGATARRLQPYRTGTPGRPTSKQLLIAEAKRRLTDSPPKNGDKLEDFATEMRNWLAKEHPAAPQIEQSAARNILRPIFKSNA